jgi:DNA-binding CsgD family transcriptional regulator
MVLAEFIEDTLATDDTNHLFGSYLKALGEFGIDRVMYSALRNTPHEENEIPGISHCYPDDWVNFYMVNDYVHLDPVRQHCLVTRNGFMWDEMQRRRDLTSEQIRLMDEGREAGLHDGLAIPFHGPFGEVYGVGLACSTHAPDLNRSLREIEIMSVHFHTVFSSLHGESRSAIDTKLTPREKEVVKWCSMGKSNWAIGEILGISEHGVDFHMRNILRKLNADNRVTAVVKALHSGLISI